MSREYVPVVCMSAVRLIQHDFERDAKLIDYVRDRALFILAYPPFLKSHSEQEQDQFFDIFISSLIGYAEIKNIDSNLWTYLLKYFWDNKIVHWTFQRIKNGRRNTFSWLSEKFESIWNEKVQLNGLTYKQAREKHESVEELENTNLSLDNSWKVVLQGTTNAWYNRNIHIVIYKRSKSWKLTEPQIFVIPQWEWVDWNVPWKFLSGKYSYKVFAHGNSLPFRWQRELPKEIEYVKARGLQEPIKYDNSWNDKKWSTWSKQTRKWEDTKAGKGNTESYSWERETLEELFPDEIEVVTEKWTEYIDFLFNDSELDWHQNYIRFSVTESWALEYQSQTFAPNKEMIWSHINNFQNLAEVEIRKIIAKRKEEKENRERAESEKAIKKQAEEEKRLRLENMTKAREDLVNGWGFGKILNDWLHFLAETSTDKRLSEQGMAYWKIYPSDGIVRRINQLSENLWFIVSLDYDKDEQLSCVSLRSKEHGYADYSCDSFPPTYRQWEITDYGREITDALAERIIGTLFKYNFTQDKKNKKAAQEISKKVQERAQLITQTKQRLKAWEALAADLPEENNDGEIVRNEEDVKWDARIDIGYVSMYWGNGTVSLNEIEALNLWIQWRVLLLRAWWDSNQISVEKSLENINMVIDHIRSDESEFLIDYFFRRIYKTVKLSFKTAKKPKILGETDSFTAFTWKAKEVVNNMRIRISEDINEADIKVLCLEVLENFKENKVELAVVKPKVFKPKDLAYSE